ncbi:MAG: DUF433 domain-containing protein [Chloroflexi bacterium]|nr:DUF433 domain-containing protein [Chloroflexota bacterium]
MAEPRIIIDPKICHGKPVLAGTRIMVANILSLLAGGYTVRRITEYYPELTEEAVTAAIRYATNVVSEEDVFPLRSETVVLLPASA